MKFNYDLYRPKKFIQDAWKANSGYFRAKDVQVTPLTKIGDADEVYKSQSAGRIPALAQRFKRKRLTLNEILPRRKKIPVHSADQQNNITVRVRKPVRALAQQLDTLPAKGGTVRELVARATDLSRELATAIQRTWLGRRAVVSQLLLAVMVIAAGAGPVHAYINRSHAIRTDSSNKTATQANAKSETKQVEQSAQQAPPTPPEPSEAPTPPTQPDPQNSAPIADTTSDDKPVLSDKSPAPTNNVVAPAPAGNTSSTPPPVTTPPAPSAPVSEPTSPTAPPTTEPQQPTTPPSSGTETPPAPDGTQQTTSPDTNVDTHTSPTTQSGQNSTSTSTSIKDRKSTTQ